MCFFKLLLRYICGTLLGFYMVDKDINFYHYTKNYKQW